MNHPDLGGVHFTGSTAVFQGMWKTVGANIAGYRGYPRIVGETGGKDFVFAHASSDPDALATGLIRGAYEYQGQKCSAASRAYIPRSLWDRYGDEWCHEIEAIKCGDPADLTNFMGAVIDRASYNTLKSAIEGARADAGADVVCGGHCDDSRGYFVAPTLIRAHDPRYRTMEVELFGPVLTVYVYDDDAYEETLELCDKTSPYGLTGAIFGTDRKAINLAHGKLANAAGELLHQRQADRGGGRPAAVRRLARLGDERQGRQPAEHDPLGQSADHQGELPAPRATTATRTCRTETECHELLRALRRSTLRSGAGASYPASSAQAVEGRAATLQRGGGAR